MATVRMSKTLIDQILKNFAEQCATAYANSTGVGDFVTDVHQSLHDDMFFTIIEEYHKFQVLVGNYIVQKSERNASYYNRHIEAPRFPFTIVNSVPFVVNPARPDSQNRTQIEAWSMETYDAGPVETRDINLPENFVDGDELIELPITSSIEVTNQYSEKINGMPFHKRPNLERSYGLHDDFRHKQTGAKWPIIISASTDVERIKTVASGTFKIKQAVEDMENYLGKLSTLKQFIDNWPGADNLVPDEYMQRHAKKTVRTKTVAEQIPDLPDELKSDVNAAILENKLVGEL
tara:strand:+ start:189 stop:1061 length:873 start_codon:yes stop_codon:yes gene_type:complete